MILGYGNLRLPGQLGGYGRTVAPGPATGLSVSANVTVPHVDLTWTAPTFGGAVDGYSINRSTDGVNYVNVGDSATTSFTDTTTAESTLYYYVVVAYNYSAGEAAASNVDTITTGSASAAPTNLAVSLVNDTGVLTWDAVSGADGYKVERTLTGAGSWSEIDDVATNTATDTYSAVDTGYDYRVRAYIGASNGAYSSTVTAYSPILYCTFTAGNGTRVDSAGLPDIGSNNYSLVTFTSGTSDLEVLANQLVRSTGTGQKWGMYDTGRTTWKSKVDVIYNTITYVQLVRYSATNLCFAVYFGPGSGGSIIIYKSSGGLPGSFAEVARNDGLGALSGTYEFIVENSASSIVVTVTGYGTLTHNTTDYNTYTSAGLFYAASGGAQSAMDNHVIWRPQ